MSNQETRNDQSGEKSDRNLDTHGDEVENKQEKFTPTRRDVLASGIAALGMSTGISRAQAASIDGTVGEVSAGHLHLKLKEGGDGIHLQSLYDELGGRELLANRPGPLWKIVLYDPETENRTTLRADEGWQATEIKRYDRTVEATCRGAKVKKQETDEMASNHEVLDIDVSVRVTPEASEDALNWDIEVQNDSDQAVYQVAFPQAGLREMESGKLFYPTDEGRVDQNPWDDFETFALGYPTHWNQLHYFSVYESGNTGLYLGVHDETAATKSVSAKALSNEDGLRLRFMQPAPDMVVAGNDFELSGENVWQLHEGSWYDAAMIYRDWVTENAPWYPELGPDGREDTPKWMKELPVWVSMWTRAQTSIEPQIDQVKEFIEYMDVPVGVHWYAWHEHHHDDDYPSYTAKSGFAEGIQELHEAGAYVMPYINSRLWDVDLDSFEEIGRKGACKAPNGEPYIRTNVGQTNTDFATMDPSTDIWQNKIRDTTLWLFDEHDVDTVYLDQLGNSALARAHIPDGYPPDWQRNFGDSLSLDCDPDHGHPLGGGHWWTDGYREMLAGIRDQMPTDKTLTCEHTPEVYVDQLDGGLAWTWGRGYLFGRGRNYLSVPAFVAVYGGAMQMFGRAWEHTMGNVDKMANHEAFIRMRAAKMLTYGNQLGWWPSRVVEYEPIGSYMRRLVRLRTELSRYFYAGRMCRPPDLDVPMYTVHYPRRGGFDITRNTVMTAAWKLSNEDKLILIFVNPTDEPISTTIDLDLKQYELDGEVSVRRIGPEGETSERFTSGRQLERKETFDSGAAWAWEIVPEDED